jgi:thioredoxin-related protein
MQLRIIFSLLLFLPVFAYPKLEIAAIKFEKGLSWAEVVEKAKSENKYIFVDCFTTWCGPCRRMDKEVYTNDSVGEYFNDKFVSVKLQMDRTEHDEVQTQQLYATTETFSKSYRVDQYPTFLFFRPDGKMVHKDIGYKKADEFMQVAETALEPGRSYTDPFNEYDSLIAAYKRGQKNYQKMPYMVKSAFQLQDTVNLNALATDLNKYLLTVDSEELYTKENIEFIASVVGSRSKFFPLFFPHGDKVDSVMNKRGYAENVLDKIIQREIVYPVIQLKAEGLREMDAAPKSKKEPDWSALEKKIKAVYNAAYARRNVLDAKIAWYQDVQNYEQYSKNFIARFETYGIDTTDEWTDINLNAAAWDIFLHITSKKYLNTAIGWMEEVVRRSARVNPGWNAATIDTYANLLYKVGRKAEAKEQEQRAIAIAKDDEDTESATQFAETLKKMKADLPTWTP